MHTLEPHDSDQVNRFKQFVAAEVKVAKDHSIEPKKVLAEWRTHLESLYKIIDSAMAPYIKAGSVELTDQEISINEPRIGTYTAKKIVLKIGSKEVSFVPIGTNLIAAKGRVDITGPSGTAKIVLVDAQALKPNIRVTIKVKGENEDPPEDCAPVAWAWKLASPPPTIRYTELNEATLLQSIMEVANG